MAEHEILELTSTINLTLAKESGISRDMSVLSALNVSLGTESDINQSLSLTSLVELEEV